MHSMIFFYDISQASHASKTLDLKLQTHMPKQPNPSKFNISSITLFPTLAQQTQYHAVS